MLRRGRAHPTEPVRRWGRNRPIERAQHLEGELVFRQNVGELEPGEHRFAWSGQDSDGNQLPVETYQITASAIKDGRMQIAPVSILETVSSVSWNPNGQQLDLQLLGGDTVSLAEIQTIAE